MLRSLHIALVTGLVLFPLLRAEAREPTKTRRIVSHAMDARVYTFEMPEDWRVVGAKKRELVVRSGGDEGGVQITLAVLDIHPKRLERTGWGRDPKVTRAKVLDAILEQYVWFKEQKDFGRSTVASGGRVWLRREQGPTRRANPLGATLPARRGVLIRHDALSEDMRLLTIQARGLGPVEGSRAAALHQWLPQLKALVASTRVEPVSSLPAERRAALPTRFQSERIEISRKRDYVVRSQAGLWLPSGWTATVISKAPANAERIRGQLAIRITPPKDAWKGPAAPEAMLLIEGLDPGTLRHYDFLDTLDPRLTAVLEKPRLLAGEPVQLRGLVQLASLGTRLAAPMKHTFRRRYAGTDTKGRPIRLTAYTTGGMSVAAHVLVMAHEADMPRFEKVVRDVVESASVSIESPSLRLR